PVQRQAVRGGRLEQLVAGLRQRDVEDGLARLHAGQQELQAHRGLARARFAFEQVQAVGGEPAAEDVVEALDTRADGRGGLRGLAHAAWMGWTGRLLDVNGGAVRAGGRVRAPGLAVQRCRDAVVAILPDPHDACVMAPANLPPASTISLRRLALLLAGLAMFGPFSIDTIFPAFPQLGGQLGADKLALQQTISVYLIAYAVTSVVHGPLSDAFGRRRVIIAGLAVFTLASVGCALSTDLTTLLVFRALQGLSAGVGLIVGRAVIRDVLDGDDAQRLMSQVSMIFGIAPAIAPII